MVGHRGRLLLKHFISFCMSKLVSHSRESHYAPALFELLSHSRITFESTTFTFDKAEYSRFYKFIVIPHAPVA